jgi:methionyl-tRNA formyltransferase
MKNLKEIKWAFFGSSHFSVLVLNELESLGALPQLIVTTPDKPRGRGLKIEPGEVRAWAEARNIPVLAPESLKNGAGEGFIKDFESRGPWDTALIASYGKIVPLAVLNIPARGTLNIHPSLLPKLRGPSPIESAILEENETGVTIMQVDEQVDHGPIVAARPVVFSSTDTQTTTQTAINQEWPPYFKDAESTLAREGAKLFAEVLPGWVSGEISAQEQNHSAATFTKKFEKEDLRLNLTDSDADNSPTLVEKNLRKIRAFSENRGAYYFQKSGDKEIRVIVTRARTENGKLIIEKVKPEGKNEMGYKDFLRGVIN